ncbi:hypothetical protein AB0F15_22875 [Amycolatopsis sp. NPDC026612]|uniref:hypothetical protein n=1 Tax=Amycolatopsis sp. NPDC026612 TaxID=3155466 RepID=UPI0033F6F37B
MRTDGERGGPRCRSTPPLLQSGCLREPGLTRPLWTVAPANVTDQAAIAPPPTVRADRARLRPDGTDPRLALPG